MRLLADENIPRLVMEFISSRQTRRESLGGRRIG